MGKSKKKPVKAKLFASSAVQAIAVVVLTIGAGALVLPRILADTTGNPLNSVTNLKAVPGNGAGYGVTVNWDGTTIDHYIVRHYEGSTFKSYSTTSRFYQLQGLNCNIAHRFDVYAADRNQTPTSATRSVSNVRVACPMATFNGVSVSGNTLTATWANANFASSYVLQYRPLGGALQSVSVPGTSKAVAGSCNTTYQFYVTASHGGQSGPAVAAPGANQFKTGACPVTPQPPTTPNNPQPPKTPQTPVKTGGGSSGSSSNNAEPAGPPATPENFSSVVTSSKVVQLAWDAAERAAKYIVSRSTDQVTWVQIAETENTYYDDESADFSTTYYYQLQAVSDDGQVSGIVTAEATTEAFEASSNTITSDDKKVSVKIPDGAIDGEYSCSLTTDESASKAPTGQSSIVGPYDLVCVSEEGDIISEFSEPLAVTIKLGNSAQGYKDLSVRLTEGRSWTTQRNITYNQNKQEIGFKLAKAQSFGVFGVKQKSSAWIIFLIFFLLLLVAAVIFFILRRRRGQSDPYATASVAAAPAAVAGPTPEEEFRQAVAQPDCSHLSMAQQVIPSSAGCKECEQQGTHWNSLRICLVCGHVGCSDDSDEQHALKHYNETGHPLIYEYGNPEGNSIGWCYIDQTYI